MGIEADMETLRSLSKVSCLDAGRYNMCVKVRGASEGGTRFIFTVPGCLLLAPWTSAMAISWCELPHIAQFHSLRLLVGI